MGEALFGLKALHPIVDHTRSTETGGRGRVRVQGTDEHFWIGPAVSATRTATRSQGTWRRSRRSTCSRACSASIASESGSCRAATRWFQGRRFGLFMITVHALV